MKKILFIFLSVCLTSCATLSRQQKLFKVSSAEYIDITSFCDKHQADYVFDTVDDIVWISSPENEIKILLTSRIALSGGSVFYLKSPPLKLKGEIFVPRQLEEIILSQKPTAFAPLFNIKTLVIDPGHGGKDPGAISKTGLREKDVNLAVSRYLKRELEKKGFRVFLTRSSDIYLSLVQRVSFARKCDADLFISIHANSNRSRKVSGVEVYHLTPSRLNSLQRSLKLARSETFPGTDTPFTAKVILWDLLITRNYRSSVELSDTLHFTFKKLGFKVRPPCKAPFYVLRFAYVPSVLVEIGYLSNYHEEKAIRKTHYQKQLAEAIALGVVSLRKRYADFIESGRLN